MLFRSPGQRLVSAAVARGIPVQVVPGPSAVTMAVALAGFSSGRFLFHGFLPHKAGQRCRVLQSLAPLPYSLVFFESPFRTLASLQDMRDALGDRRAMVARELTKKFEEVLRGKLSELITQLGNRTIKGEVTVVVEGADQ